MTNLLIVNIDENIEKVNKIINKDNLDKHLILYLNNTIINKSKDFILFDDLLKPGHNSKIYREVRKFSKNWYKPIESKLKYFNISLGNLIELGLFSLWPTFLKIEILYEFIKKQKPSKINIITEYEEDIKIIKEIIKNKNIILNYKLFKTSNKNSFNIIFRNLSHKYIAKFQNLLLKFYFFRKKRKNNILFLGNLRQTAPLLNKLKQNKNNIIIRAGEDLGRGIFTKYCDYFLTFNAYSNLNNKKIRLIKKELNEKFNILKQNQKYLYYKIPLFNVLESRFKQLFFTDFLNLIKYIEIIKNIGKKIDIVVTHYDVLPFEKTIVLSANKLKIPTLTMIEGFLPVKQLKKDNLFVPFYAEKIALYAESQKNIIKSKYKIGENKLVVTGYPLFDQYYNNKPISQEKIYKSYNIPLNKKIILYTAERYNKNKARSSLWGAFTQKQCENVYEELFKTFKEFPELFLIIKKHPSGSLDDYTIKNIAKKLNFNNYVISTDTDIYNLINTSFAIITRQSNMGLESMLLNKYVIIMDTFFDTNDHFGYTEFNAALHTKKSGELKKILFALLNNNYLQEKLRKNIQKFVKYHYSVNDGNSSERMANLINEIIKQKHL